MKKNEDFSKSKKEERLESTLEAFATQIVYRAEDIEDYSALYVRRQELEKRVTRNFPRRKPVRNWLLVAILGLAVLFLFGMTYHLTQNYRMTSNELHNNFHSTLSYFERLPSKLPKGYRLEEKSLPAEPSQTRSILFVTADDRYYVKFTEANYQLTESLDGEQVMMETVSIANQYNGTVVQKEDGTMLLWEQEGYFYLLLTNDPDLSSRELTKMASSLE